MKDLIKSLDFAKGSVMDSSIMQSGQGISKYDLNPVSPELFSSYEPYEAPKDFKLAAFDGGSLMIYETPTIGFAYYKLAFRQFQVNLEEKTCTTVEINKDLQHGLFLLSNNPSEGFESYKDFENGSLLKTKETEFILGKLDLIDESDLLLIDGSIERETLPILEKHRNTMAVSKRTFHTIGGYSAQSFMAKKAKEHGKDSVPWFAYPIVKKYPERAPSQISFGTFRKNSVVFRLDFPNDFSENNVVDCMRKVGICALDSKYGAYPYPLGAVHSDAVMRRGTKDKLRRFIKKELREGNANAYERLKEDLHHAEWYDKMRGQS